MKNFSIKNKIIACSATVAAILGIYASVHAATPGIPITVPSAASAGYVLTSTAGGTYQASSTEGLTIGSLNATSTKTSTFMGKVGVGSSTPSFTLGVQGNELVSGNISTANLTATGTVTLTDLSGTNSGGLRFGSDVNIFRLVSGQLELNDSTGVTSALAFGLNGSVAGKVFSDAANTLKFATGGITVLTINSSQNAGIGANSSGSKLQVGASGNSYQGLLVYGGDGGAGSTLADFRGTGDTSVLYLRGNGSVGINTNAPQAKLEITTAVGEILRTSFSSDLTFYHSIFGGYSGTVASSYLAFNVNTGTASTQTEVLRLVGNGNAGIGSSTPSRTLSVQGSALISGDITSVANLTATGTITTAGALSVGTTATLNGNVTMTSIGSNIKIVATTGSNPAYLRFTANGVDGFVGQNGTAAGGLFTANGLAGAMNLIAPSGSAVQMGDTASANFTLLSTGKTGLGTTSPSQILSVQGSTIVSGDIVSVANITATGTAKISGNITGAGGIAASIPYASSTAITVTTIYTPTYPVVSYATSTAMTGTTTIQLGVTLFPEKWNSFACYTDVGTMVADFYHGSTHPGANSASSTPGVINFSSNNTLTAGEKRFIDVGTPATSPTKISCTLSRQNN